jgi:hypothetical protein
MLKADEFLGSLREPADGFAELARAELNSRVRSDVDRLSARSADCGRATVHGGTFVRRDCGGAGLRAGNNRVAAQPRT